MNQKQIYLFDRFVLAHIHLWASNHIAKGEHTPEFCYRLRTAGHQSQTLRYFNPEEGKVITKLGEEKDFLEIKQKEISLIVMALEVARIWVEDRPKSERPNIGISDKKMIMGKNHYFRYLMNMKRKDKDIYNEQKELIEETSSHAIKWYNYTKLYIENTTLGA